MSKLFDAGLLPEGRFFRYLGGKSNLLNVLLPLIPSHRIYVELFGGSGELLFAKPKCHTEVYNDVDGDLVNLFRVVRDKPLEFLEKAEFLVYSRELKENWARDPPPADPVEWAVRTWYVYQCAFAGKRFTGWAFSRSKTNHPKSLRTRLDRITGLHKRIAEIYVDCLDFRRCIRNWDTEDTFFFMDPPYRGSTQANRICMSDEDYSDLAQICRKLQGKFLLTVNAESFFRELFDGFTFETKRCMLSAKGVTRNATLKTRGHYAHYFIRNYRAPRRKRK